MRCLSFLLLAALAFPAASADDAAALLDCIRANIPPAVRVQQLALVAVDRDGGERELRGRVFAQRTADGANVMMRIDAPPDMAGAAFLVREAGGRDDMYLYLPALQRVRRIHGSGANGRLFGTDLSYEDVKRIQSVFSGASVRELEPVETDGRSLRRLEFEPRAESPWRRVLLLVDPSSCVVLRVEQHDDSGLARRIVADPASLQQVDGHWYAARLRLEDLREGTQTRITIDGVRVEPELSSRWFNPHSFHIGG